MRFQWIRLAALIVLASLHSFPRATAQVVEGIETDAQEALVRDVGIAHAQGYRFGEPVAAADITPLRPR